MNIVNHSLSIGVNSISHSLKQPKNPHFFKEMAIMGICFSAFTALVCALSAPQNYTNTQRAMCAAGGAIGVGALIGSVTLIACSANPIFWTGALVGALVITAFAIGIFQNCQDPNFHATGF